MVRVGLPWPHLREPRGHQRPDERTCPPLGSLRTTPPWHGILQGRAVQNGCDRQTDGKSFLKLIIKVRDQIVADGLQLEDYDVTDVGAHLTAKDWNDAIENHDPVVVDMRNHYESEIGH